MSDVRKSLAEKLEKYYQGSGTPEEKAEAHLDVIEEEKTAKMKVDEMLSKKLSLSHSLKGWDKSEQKKIASKYMDHGISEILQSERKTRNLLAVAQDDVDRFIESEKKRHIKEYNKTSLVTLSDEEKEERAEKAVYDVLVRGSAYYDEDKKAKKKFDELRAEVSRCNTEYNAVLLAKQSFLDENEDLIAEARRQKRLRELKKSGILEELDLVEKAEKKAEEA